MLTEPLVSVVTPFYNTAPYLAECIESVLAQTYSNYEYILVNNKSTDGSREIAESYARRDSRIRLLENRDFLTQNENYNGALERISPDSKYVKFAQADDVLFPDCITRMVQLAEREPRIAIVSSYYLFGEYLDGGGVPYQVTRIPGREACRQILLSQRSLTGSQTTVMYRADLVRARRPFFTPGRFHNDTEAAFEILLDHDLGYVHQVLSFSRSGNPSFITSAQPFNPLLLNYLSLTERYGSQFLSQDELAALTTKLRRKYYIYLGWAFLRRPGQQFWDFHQKGLANLGQTLPWPKIALGVVIEICRLVLNPENVFERLVARLRRYLAAPDARG